MFLPKFILDTNKLIVNVTSVPCLIKHFLTKLLNLKATICFLILITTLIIDYELIINRTIVIVTKKYSRT